MKIKTRLRLNTWISLAALMLMLLSLAWSFREIYRTDRNETLVNEMRKAAFERISLRDEYLLYQEERPRFQWYAKSETLRGLLEAASERFTGKKDKALVRDARDDFDATFSLFSTLLEKHRQEGRTVQKGFAFNEADSRLIAYVFLKAYALNDSIGRLYEATEEAAIRARERGVFLVVFFFVAGGMAIVVNSILLNRTVANRVAAIAKGVGVIGGGNLDYRIDAQGDDELSDLARTSNEMVVKLKESYTSVENLQREITERKRVENELARLNLQNELILCSAAEGILGLDLQGNHTFVNPAAARMLGYDPEELIGRPSHSIWHHTKPDGSPYHEEECAIYASYRAGAVRRVSTEVFWRKDGTSFLVEYASTPIYEQGRLAGAVVTFADVTERKRMEAEREKLIRVLEGALARVKQLSGLLPICASCKKIREDNGYWTQIEAYVRDHSEAEFSHGICPECEKKLYPEFTGG